MSENNTTFLICTAMVCVAATVSLMFLSQCEHKTINVTCDTSKKECLDWLYRVEK
jgi:hypothetical protein